MAERLQKIMSQWGIASRRQSEALIREGKVRLNGEIAQVGQKADPIIDQIEVDGKILHPHFLPQQIYLLIHKPRGVVSTCRDPQGRKTILELLPQDLQQSYGIHPVGRLDQETTGALLLTNDGDLTYRLTHPKHHIEKTYCVWLQGDIPNIKINQWRKGINLDGILTLPAKIRRIHPVLSIPSVGNSRELLLSCLEIKIIEGRKRQIRRVAKELGHDVVHLHRTHIGLISLSSIEGEDLVQGGWRHLTEDEVQQLKL